MLTFVEARFFRTCSFMLARRFSIAPDTCNFPPEYPNNNHEEYIDKNKDFSRIRSEDVKSLRIAMIGLPNVGKSTLVNSLIERPICATSERIHVTRVKTDAVYTRNNTQLVFIDTPGLVSAHEFKKFELEESFRLDVQVAMEGADIVGVVQDVSNKYTRGMVHNRVLELLKMSRIGVPSILIMNKVDRMKHKRELLALVNTLTSQRYWPNFSDVFMVSALKSDGIDDLRNYLLDSAKSGDWQYQEDVVSDQQIERVIERTVRAKLLDALPNEVPYRLQVVMEHMNTIDDGTIVCIVQVRCPSDRIAKLVMGPGGRRIRNVALDAEQQLSNAFRNSIRLRIAVEFEKSK